MRLKCHLLILAARSGCARQNKQKDRYRISESGLFISQAKNISHFFVYNNEAKMIKIPVLMIIFKRPKIFC